MLTAVIGGKEDIAQMHFHDYLRNKFPKIIGKGITAGQIKEIEQLDSNEE